MIVELSAKVVASEAQDCSVPQQHRAEGCKGGFYPSESFAAPTKHRGAARYAPLICKVLQKMQPALRRKVVRCRLVHWQRVALEACMASQKQSPPKVRPPMPSTVTEGETNAAEMRHPDKTKKLRKYGGVFRSECDGVVYGYYAKAGICNITFTARIHCDLADAVRDHITLSKLLERIQTQSLPANFPEVVKSVVEAASGVNGFLSPSFFRHFTVSFPTRFWIGRVLSLHCQHIEGALHAWKLLDAFKDPTGPTAIAPENRMESAEQQWNRVHSALEALDSGFGTFHSSQLGAVLQENKRRRSTVLGLIVAKLDKQQKKHVREATAKATLDQVVLLRRFEELKRSWERAIAREDQRKQTKKLREGKKRRWDGKESRKEFERRAGC